MSATRKVALLTNFIPPYYISVLEHLCHLLGSLRIYVSTPMETNRAWVPQWRNLPVTVQKCWTFSTHWNHAHGFTEETTRHVPYDTLALLLRERPDVVISAQFGARTFQAAIYRLFFRQSRLIVWTALSEETEQGLSRFRSFQRRTLLRVADAVLANGASATRYLQNLGVPGEKIFRLPYCATIAPYLEFSLKRKPSIARRLLSVGQLIPRKGLLPFLRVLSKWLHEHPDARCEFWIAGDGPLRGELETLPLSPRLELRFLGTVAYERLPELYARAGIFVFPTLADEWGVVVNEALAAGLPILGSIHSQAVQELVEEAITGWRFRPTRPEEAYAALDRAMSASNADLDEMRRAGRERIGRFAPQYGAQCFLAAIDFVCSLRGADSASTKALPTTKQTANDEASLP